MTNSIKWRLVAIYVILVVIVMVIAGTLVVWTTSNEEYDSMKNQLVTSANVIDKQLDPSLGVETIKLDIRTITQQFTDQIVYLINADGEIVYPVVSANNEDFLYAPQVQGALTGQQMEELDSVNIDGDTYKYRGYAKPIIRDGTVEYVVYIMTSTEAVEKTIKDIIRIILYAVVLAIFVASILGVVFSNFITRPITMLTTKARQMADGNLTTNIEVQSLDEIGELTKNFNIMAESLNATMGEISSEKNKLEIVFSQMTDGLLVFNTKGILISHNPASERMLHVKENEHFDDIFSFYIEDSFQSLYVVAKGEVASHIIKKSDRYYNVAFAKFIGQSKDNSGLITVVQDVTEHKKLELMQKEFVANVSHELRTPLTTIKSYTETLLEGAADEADIRDKFLNVINHEGDRMTALVQDLLELSKLDNKQTKFKMIEINLNKLVSDSAEKYKIHADKKKQVITYHQPKHQYNIVGDMYRIEQVLKNIISNAIKYSPDQASIDVSVNEDIKNINVVVEDTGLGISQADLERIFDRFYRVDKARSREMGGTGLGLAIAKEIMEYHGGTIEVESELGHGTTFYLIFPKTYKKKRAI